MLALENADEILQILDRFTKQKSKDIPPELEEYIGYVAKSGDTVYPWPTVQYLFREKLRNVIKEFHDTTASIEDLPQCPNVDQFNYESMKTLLFERFDNFQAAPFTVQRLCELLTDPKKHYSRLDKFMRALEKNILVVSTVEPGRKPLENDDGDHLTANGDILSDISNDIEIAKNGNKSSTNGTTEKHNDCDASESLAKIEVPSSSGISTVTASEAGAKEAEAEMKDAPDQGPVEKPSESAEAQQSATVTSAEPQTTNDEEMVEKMKSSADESADTKPAEPMVEADAGKQDAEIDTTTPEKPELKATPEKADDKTEDPPAAAESPTKTEVASESAAAVPAAAQESPIGEKKEAVPETEAVKSTPPTPKRSANDVEDADDGEGDSKNPCAKKIRLDLDASEAETAAPEPAIIPEEDLLKEADILDSISTEIDAQKESELLGEVDSSLDVDKAPITIDIQPIAESVAVDSEAESKSVDKAPAAPSDSLKTDDAPEAIPSELDFTPDEALNELVSSDILAAVIPEQPIEEVKMNDEPANATEPAEVAPETAPEPTAAPTEVAADSAVAAAVTTTDTAAAAADEMNVESTETSNSEAETAMEAAPIKADEEQMDVDESNSVDAMDL